MFIPDNTVHDYVYKQMLFLHTALIGGSDHFDLEYSDYRQDLGTMISSVSFDRMFEVVQFMFSNNKWGDKWVVEKLENKIRISIKE